MCTKIKKYRGKCHNGFLFGIRKIPWKQVIFFEATGELKKIGSSLKAIHCNQVKVVQISDTGTHCGSTLNSFRNVLQFELRTTSTTLSSTPPSPSASCCPGTTAVSGSTERLKSLSLNTTVSHYQSHTTINM